MKNILIGQPSAPHLFGQRNRTVYFENKRHASSLKQDEPKAGLSKIENTASFRSDFKNTDRWEQETISKPSSTTIQKQKRAVSFRSNFEDEDGWEQATTTEQKSRAIQDKEIISEQERNIIQEQGSSVIPEHGSTVIQEQGSRTIQEQLRIRNNRIYCECINIAERVLTRYIPSYKKPLRFLYVLADELFEKRTKHPITAYHEFLNDKIREMQWRNIRFSRYQPLRLPLKNYEGRTESCWR